MKTLILLLACSIGIAAQQKPSADPDYGTIQDIKEMHRVYVRADDDDARAMIVKMLGAYPGLEVVNTVRDAEIVLEFTTLTRDVAANRGPDARGASMALKSQMRAYTTKADGTQVIAWTETETLDVTNGLVFGAPNEMNLTHHFVRDLQKARGEKPLSIRTLAKGKPKEKNP